jgi:hypothetical protein
MAKHLSRKSTAHWGTSWRRYIPTAIVLCLGIVMSWTLLFLPTPEYLAAYGPYKRWRPMADANRWPVAAQGG